MIQIAEYDYKRFCDDHDDNRLSQYDSPSYRVSISGNRIACTRKRRRNEKTFSKDRATGRKRLQVRKFTRSSAYRMARYLRSCTSSYTSMGTLTFPDKPAPAVAKRCLALFCKRITRLFSNQPSFSLFWFLEFQLRGSIHYHFFTTAYIHHRQLAEIWASCCGIRNPQHVAACTSIESIRSGRYGMLTYAAKYAKKQYQKQLPEGVDGVGRFWGIIGKRDVSAAVVEFDIFDALDEVNCPKYQKVGKILKKGVADGHITERWIKKRGEDTQEEIFIGIVIFDVWNVVVLKRLYDAFNDCILDATERIKMPKNWLCQANTTR